MENETRVTKEGLVTAAQKMMDRQATFGTATCMDVGDDFEIVYHFELETGMEFTHLRLKVKKGEIVPSISSVYLCASLIENEITELYGVGFDSIAINYAGGFLVTAESPKTYMIKPPCYRPEAPERLIAPCRNACPAGTDVPLYVQLVGEGKMDKALAVIKQAVPFPGILSRVCLSPCEASCRQGKQGEAISIRQLKRLAYEKGKYIEKVTATTTGKKVAVVGSGPSGLTGAYYLAKMGHSVTIFEALAEAGGYMRTGIPATELPRKVLDDEINIVSQLGVGIIFNSRIDSLDKLFEQGYDAVLVAVGAHQGVRREAITGAISGQTPVLKQLGLEATINKGFSSLKVDAQSMATSKEGVFAAGDVTVGPTSVIHTIASGKKAALAINKYLGGSQWQPAVVPAAPSVSRDTFLERLKEKRRPVSPHISMEEAVKTGEEEKVFSQEMAKAEAQRCWRCDLEE